jgi:hypothetical protein
MAYKGGNDMSAKELISVLMESPLYLEIPVVERLGLVKCLCSRPYEQMDIKFFDDKAVSMNNEL